MSKAILNDWYEKGQPLPVPGTAATRLWSQGHGPTVVCLHGVPTSAYLYRKMLPELAARGLEGVALDFPGLGFADRPHPDDFDYSWTGLSGWLERALDAAGIGAFHLVVHDVGGPVGFDLIRRLTGGGAGPGPRREQGHGDGQLGRVRSLTVLNTLVRASEFTKPWVMRPFSVPVLGRLWVATMNSPFIYPFFRWKGSHGGSYGELRAYGRLLVQGDGGRGFRAIMSRFENNAAFEERIVPSLQDRAFPAQVVWGRDDTELTLEKYGRGAREVLGLDTVHTVHGKHFLQEDSPADIAELVARLVKTHGDA